MAKFQFNLEPVLQQRVTREVSAEQELAIARKEYNRRLTLLENTRRHLEEVLKADDKKDVDIFEVLQLSFYRTSVSKKINSQEEGVAEAGFEVEKKRDEAVQARQGRLVIEKIKEKRLITFKREEDLREQKEVDELSLYAYQRKGQKH